MLPLLLGFSATMLNHAYQRSLRTEEREALQSHIYLLLAAAEPTEKGIELPPVVTEPRFSSVSSGLIGWVVDESGDIHWRSQSSELFSENNLPSITATFRPGNRRFFEVILNDQAYYAIGYDTIWEIGDTEQGFRFLVMNSREPTQNELKAYQKRLRRWLGGLAILLILVQTFIARWGLSPLRKLARELEEVEEGFRKELKGRYPADIQPVTNNLNRVLKSEQSQRERYRNTLSDLAHSLKTPLAVIRGQLSDTNTSPEQLKSLVDEQISRMSSIVDHQLRRASAQVVQTSQSSVPIKPILDRLTNALTKVYQSKGMQFSLAVPDDLAFAGDEADFMELVGNILDNACKYGERSVKVTAKRSDIHLEIMIEDDGPGVADDIKHIIMTRGHRADTATPGQGIGLAVAVDIVSSYGGSVDIVESSLGGAAFKILIPNFKP